MWVSTEKIYNGMIILGSALLVGGSLLLEKKHICHDRVAKCFARRVSVLLDNDKDAIANAVATATVE